MFRLLIGLCVLFLIVGCSSKKVKSDQDGSTLENAATSDVPINFDPQGSDGRKIDGLNTIHFPYDSSSLPLKERELLAKNADWIKAHSKIKIQIEGHCDEHGSDEYNLALGDRRAKAAMKYLVDLGIDSKQLSIISYGKEKPLTTEDSDEAQAKNRRDNFVPIR